MPFNVEQINSQGKVVNDYDVTFRGSALLDLVVSSLGSKFKKVSIGSKNVIEVTLSNGHKELLLFKSVSYLGNPHPIYKKRIQIPNDYVSFVNQYQGQYSNIRFIGLYYYDGKAYFIDFVKDSYMKRIVNNSSAHIYTNDIARAYRIGQVKKIDNNLNEIYVLRSDMFYSYLNNGITVSDELESKILTVTHFIPKHEITAIEAITEMHQNGFRNWQQTEWAGWYFEYIFNKFIKESKLDKHIKYGPPSGPLKVNLDLWFPMNDFYGDLKAHSEDSPDIMGNDIETVRLVVNAYSRLWYVVCEHETSKDINSAASQQRIDYINSVTGEQKTLPRRDIKASVKFTKLIILEINPNNLPHFKTTQEGWTNSDGNVRAPKISIKHTYLENDNFVIVREIL